MGGELRETWHRGLHGQGVTVRGGKPYVKSGRADRQQPAEHGQPSLHFQLRETKSSIKSLFTPVSTTAATRGP